MTNPRQIGRYRFRIQWEPRDLWIGVYWDRRDDFRHVYICLVPCFPLHIWWRRRP